ncbi:hypothetical protein C5S53_13605 [Methanophagales archaeon]|nr:hypothetical protein C5S53_13605 [Methanophagales archaeon]
MYSVLINRNAQKYVDSNPFFSFVVLAGFTVFMVVLGAYLFKKIKV